jgi:hypothetical protein
MSKPRPPSGHMSDMIIRRMMYDRMRYKVIREYIERRREGIERARKISYDDIEREVQFCQQRGEFWLEVVRRDINNDLDSIAEAMKLHDISSTDDRDFFRQNATDDGKKTAFSKSPDFFSTFDIFFK